MPSKDWLASLKSVPSSLVECWLATGPFRIMSHAFPDVLGKPVTVKPVELTGILAEPPFPSAIKTPSTKSKGDGLNLLVTTLPRLRSTGSVLWRFAGPAHALWLCSPCRSHHLRYPPDRVPCPTIGQVRAERRRVLW